jgi:hypothetical protein
MMLTFALWPDTAGADRICNLCDARFTATTEEYRAGIGAEYVGHVCRACVEADPDTLLANLQGPLGDARARVQQLEAVEQWLQTIAPTERRRAFHVVARGCRTDQTDTSMSVVDVDDSGTAAPARRVSSMYNRAASRSNSAVSLIVFPAATQPGKSGT